MSQQAIILQFSGIVSYMSTLNTIVVTLYYFNLSVKMCLASCSICVVFTMQFKRALTTSRFFLFGENGKDSKCISCLHFKRNL